MVDEIRSRPAPAQEFPPDDKVTLRRPGEALFKPGDFRLDGNRLAGEWWGGEAAGEAPERARDRQVFERLAQGDADATGSRDIPRDGSAGPESDRRAPADAGGSAPAGLGAAAAVLPNPFQLVGQLAGGEVLPAGGVDMSRYELAARIGEAAEALAVRVDAEAAESEVRIEFKDGTLPGTSAVVRREKDGGLAVEFSTSDSRANLFLANGNAALRNHLADRFGCEVRVNVEYLPERQAGERGDERGRRPGANWEAW